MRSSATAETATSSLIRSTLASTVSAQSATSVNPFTVYMSEANKGANSALTPIEMLTMRQSKVLEQRATNVSAFQSTVLNPEEEAAAP